MAQDSHQQAERTLHRQGFGAPGGGIVEAVERAVGLNAQTPHGPIVGLWSRLGELDLDEYATALQSYRLVKANLMRGTVHLVSARQYRAWRTSLHPALVRTVKQFCPGLATRVDLDAVVAAGCDALADADPERGLTRGDLGTAIAPRFPNAEAKELGFAVRLLAPVVQVADHDVWRPQRTTYVLADGVLPREDAAGIEPLPIAYLRGFGPATAADATYFTGLTGLAAELKRGTTPRAGTTARTPWFDVADPPTGTCSGAVVLAEYENIYFAHKDGALQPARKRLIPNTATRMHGSLVWRGEPVAAWRPVGGHLALDPWTKLSADVRRVFTDLEDFYAEASKETR